VLQSRSECQISFQIERHFKESRITLRSPTRRAFAAAALASPEAAEAEDPLVVLSPPVAVAVAAGPLHTIDLGKIDATDVGVEKERGVYVPVSWDVLNWGAV
jgi:hypothetical protein